MSWWPIVLIGMASLVLRASFLMLAPNLTVPPRAIRALGVAAPILLATITAPEITTGQPALLGARLVGSTVAVVVAWRTRSILPTVGLGLAAYWLVQILTAG